MAFQGCHGAKYSGEKLMIMDLATMAHPPKNPLKNQLKWHFRPKFSSPAARYKGLRLGDRAGQPWIRHPIRDAHTRRV